MSEDYHHYVFRDGILVGDFEGMYVNSEVIPWHQDKEAESWIGDMAVHMIAPFSDFDSGLEIGCGMGYFANRVAPFCRKFTGIDVSPTAVQKAKDLFGHIRFEVGDITSEDFGFKNQDFVMVKDLLWYVFPKIGQVIKNLSEAVKQHGTLCIFQSFPNLASQFIGKEVIPSPEVLIECLQAQFSLIHSCALQRHAYPNEGPMFIGIFERNSTPNIMV